MAIQSSDVAVGSDILASSYNYLRADLLTNAIDISGVKSFLDGQYISYQKTIQFLSSVGAADSAFIYSNVDNQLMFATGGANRQVITNTYCNMSGIDLYISATKKLYLDGGGDTYIVESAANVITVYRAGSWAAQLDTNGFSVAHDLVLPATKKFYLDSGIDTYITEGVANRIVFVAGGSNLGSFGGSGLYTTLLSSTYSTANGYISVSSGQLNFYNGTRSIYSGGNFFLPDGDGVVSLGAGTSQDWNVIYYHTLSQHCSQKDKENIELFDNGKIKTESLPTPKTYTRKDHEETEFGLIAEDCPEEVQSFDKDGVCMINTNALITYMVGVIKKLDERIQALEAK